MYVWWIGSALQQVSEQSREGKASLPDADGGVGEHCECGCGSEDGTTEGGVKRH